MQRMCVRLKHLNTSRPPSGSPPVLGEGLLVDRDCLLQLALLGQCVALQQKSAHGARVKNEASRAVQRGTGCCKERLVGPT